MYKGDKVWLEAKQVAKANGFSSDWATVIDYYYLNGGENVKIFSILNDNKYRILGITDDGDVILGTRDDKAFVEQFTTVFESQKIFFYAEETVTKEIDLPQGCTYLSKHSMSIRV